MTVDLLVCNYNTKDRLEDLLQTLNWDYKPGAWNLFVADNGSTDGSYEWLSQNADRFSVERVIKNPNVGYSEAINNMSTLCDSEILCAVNADTWFSTEHVKEAELTFLHNPMQAIMGPKQVDSSGVIRHGGIFWDGKSSPVHRGWQETDANDELYKDRLRCWTVSGSIYYVRRSAWDEMTNHPGYRNLFPRATGAMLPTFMYFEETWTSIFASHLGYEVWYDGTIPTAGHSWHASNTPGDNVHHFHQARELYRMTADRLGVPHEIK